MGGDALLRLGVGQREHRVGRAARLEGADVLQVLALEEQPRIGGGVEHVAGQHRGALDVGGDAGAGGLDVGEGQQGVVGHGYAFQGSWYVCRPFGAPAAHGAGQR